MFWRKIKNRLLWSQRLWQLKSSKVHSNEKFINCSLNFCFEIKEIKFCYIWINPSKDFFLIVNIRNYNTWQCLKFDFNFTRFLVSFDKNADFFVIKQKNNDNSNFRKFTAIFDVSIVFYIFCLKSKRIKYYYTWI